MRQRESLIILISRNGQMLTSSSATALAGERLLWDLPAWGAGGFIDESQLCLQWG